METQETPESQRRDDSDDASELLGGVTIAIIGFVFLVFHIPHIAEVYRIRNGTTAAAIVTKIEAKRNRFFEGRRPTSSWNNNPDPWGRYYITTAFSFFHNGIEYHGNRLTVFEEFFERRTAAIKAYSAAVTPDGKATVYFDPDDPSSAVLDTRVTFSGLRYLMLGSALVSMGALILYRRNRPHWHQPGSHLLVRTFKSGLTAYSIRGGFSRVLRRSMNFQIAVWIIMLIESSLDFEISPPILWIFPLIPPVFMLGVPLLLYRYFNRNSLNIEMDDDAGVLRLFRAGLLARTRKPELCYSNVIDVDSVESARAGRSRSPLALHTLVLYLSDTQGAREIRLDGFDVPFTSCETVRALILSRIGGRRQA